ncbi:S1C family serine protease [Bifidobacterium castoris]|uniref:Peptidase n=1 Tax=Bifidobacterium castoris TaxID=2306972 RepID=A0A430F8L7_9BIFI|nr:trypsin-like peptidase domain-containing protein [Bifidobacterium castoris]RSX49174.1 peptidase [Bifidobacterium castoris]
MSDENRYPWETSDSDGAQPNTAHTNDAPADDAAPARQPDASASSDDAPTHTLPPLQPATPNADDAHTTPIPSAGAQPAQQPASQGYRSAPLYGAYAPTTPNPQPTQPTQQPDHQQTQPTSPFALPFQNQNIPGANQQPHAGRSPYVPLDAANSGAGNNDGGAGAPGAPTSPGAPFGDGDPHNPYTDIGREETKSHGVLIGVVAAVVTAILCLGVGWTALAYGWVKVPTSSSISSISSNQGSSEGSAVVEGGEAPNWTAVSSKVSNAVVSISTTVDGGTAKGSGAIIDKDGHIVTNNHVVSGAKSIVVTLTNGDLYEADVVGTDSTTDLAVIQLKNPPSDLTAVEFADSAKVAVGEPIMAIGNPLGYDDTATTGIVSALNRPVSVMDEDNQTIVTNAIQIDAAVNPGNSGGPTFNAAGQVIGINSSIASTASSEETAGSIGIGFAIPSNLVKRVANEIIKNGKVEHVALGVTIKNTTVTADGVTRAGVEVQSLVSGGPAEKAGIVKGDVIVAYDGLAVTNNYSLLGFVRAAAMDSTAKLTIVRDGKVMDVDVKLDKAESDVNGSSGSDSEQQEQQRQQQQQEQQEQRNGGNGGGVFDPFGLW